jgi:hypothetical protein
MNFDLCFKMIIKIVSVHPALEEEAATLQDGYAGRAVSCRLLPVCSTLSTTSRAWRATAV